MFVGVKICFRLLTNTHSLKDQHNFYGVLERKNNICAYVGASLDELVYCQVSVIVTAIIKANNIINTSAAINAMTTHTFTYVPG